MINDQRIVEKIYVSLHVTCLTIVAIFMILSKRYAGELSQFQCYITTIDLFILLWFSIVGFVISYFFYVITKNKKIFIYIAPFRVRPFRLTNVFFCLLLLQLVFLLVTDVGRVGSQSTSPYSSIFSLLNIDAFFGFFYFLTRKSDQVKKIYFWLVVITYLVFKLLQGWSGIILVVFFFELYFYFKSRKIRPWRSVAIVLFLPLILILAGGKVYQYVLPFKFEMRGLSLTEINYTESVVNLTNRFTFFPVAVGAYEKNREIIFNTLHDDTSFREIKGLFRPFVSKSMMINKEFRSINNLVMQAFYPDITATTSSDVGLIMYAITLFSSNLAEGLLWILMTMILLVINKALIDSFEQYPGQLNFLYFLLVMKLYYTASPEMVFSYGSIGVFYLLPTLFITAAFKVKKKKTSGYI
ncbi:MAG: oligosaccharide repeat unit polymerase [Deltaproteobacteria bacterium]|nr:oligosaccharide repeat unit polymerase [Deltaproteobacteria bacterium]